MSRRRDDKEDNDKRFGQPHFGHDEGQDLAEPMDDPVEAPQAAPAAPQAPQPQEPTVYPPLLARAPSEAEVAYLARNIKGILVHVAGMGYENSAKAILDLLQRPITISG